MTVPRVIRRLDRSPTSSPPPASSLASLSFTSTSVTTISPSPPLWTAPAEAQATFFRSLESVIEILLRSPTELVAPPE